MSRATECTATTVQHRLDGTREHSCVFHEHALTVTHCSESGYLWR